MDSENKCKIPIIDLTSETLKPGSSSWSSSCKEVQKALEEYGCFIAIHDQFSSDDSDEMFKGLRELFNLPLENKDQRLADGPFSTYLGPKPGMPLYESLSITDSTNLQTVERFSDCIWPSGNPNFCERTQVYAKKYSTLDQLVGRMLFESYGVEKHLDDYVEMLTYLLVFIKYGVAEQNEIDLGLIPHTDKGFITILEENGVNGLQMKTKEGDWITVDFPPSSVIVIAGDSLKAWSNGRIHSVLHKVTASAKAERYSVAQFSYPKKLVSAPEELIDDEHPRLYKPLDAYGLRRFYHEIDEKGLKIDDVLKAYCGV